MDGFAGPGEGFCADAGACHQATAGTINRTVRLIMIVASVSGKPVVGRMTSGATGRKSPVTPDLSSRNARSERRAQRDIH